VAYFMVSLDSPEKNQDFAESLDANFPLLSDPGKQVARAYGVLGALRLFAKRRTFYIDPHKQVALAYGVPGALRLYAKRRTFYTDPQSVIRHVQENVDTASHGAQMVRTLADLGFPRAPEAPATEGDEAASP
jgi:peroxiredoxin